MSQPAVPPPGLIVVASPLRPAHRPLQAVRAFALIADRLPEWTLVFSGEGPQGPRVLAGARKYYLSDRVSLEPGYRADSPEAVEVGPMPPEALAARMLDLAQGGGPVAITLVAGGEEAALQVPLAHAVRVAESLGTAAQVGWFVAPAHGTEPPIVAIPAEHEATFRRHLTGTERGSLATVEFWPRGLEGVLVAPTRNWFSRRVPVGAPRVPHTVWEIETQTLPLLAGPAPDATRFDIDAVVTWVDGSDPAWRARRDERLAQIAGTSPEAADETSSGEARYRDHDELRFALRSLHAYAPWLRRVHLVTDRQTPAWLGEHPWIQVVDHTAILDAAALPTFNSQAIETALHKIPGLAEHFVYLNDDMLLGRPVAPDLFFSPAGLPAVLLSDLTLDMEGTDDRPYALAAFNNRRLLRERFGMEILRTIRHAPYAHRRSTLEQVVREFPDAVSATARAPFRSPTDVSMLSSLAQHYGLLAGSAYPGQAVDEFVDLSEVFVEKRLGEVATADYDFLCLGDHHSYAVAPDEVNALLQGFLTTKFPDPAPWER